MSATRLPYKCLTSSRGARLPARSARFLRLPLSYRTALALNQLLNLQLFVGVVFIDNRYLYLLAASLFPLIFLVFPMRKGERSRAPWYDWLMALIACGLLIWFACRGRAHPERRLGIRRAASSRKCLPPRSGC